MKCEYCENELPSSGADACPFCGASLASNEFPSVLQTNDDGCSIDVACPHCQSVYEISPDEWGECRECEICHESFPLTYGALSDAQAKVIWKVRIARIIEKWREGEDALFSARRSMGDILLKPGEVLYERVEGVILSETRGVRRTVSERSSHRNYEHDHWDARARRTGEHYNYQGHSETATEYEYRNLDEGVLYLTNRKLLFVGDQMQRHVNLKRIVHFVPDFSRHGEIQIAEDAKQKVLRFSSEHNDRIFFRFSLVLNALCDADFKCFLMSAPTDEVAIFFRKFFYFQDLAPQPTQLTQPTQPEQPEPENEAALKWSVSGILGGIVGVFGIARIITHLSGIRLTVALVLILVVIGFVIYKSVKD